MTNPTITRGTVTQISLSDGKNVAMVCPDGVPFNAGAEIQAPFDPPWLGLTPMALLGRRVWVCVADDGIPHLRLERADIDADIEALGP
ncbi:MAG: hypothetical protein V3R16_09590 [Nitrospirales bacterium]